MLLQDHKMEARQDLTAVEPILTTIQVMLPSQFLNNSIFTFQYFGFAVLLTTNLGLIHKSPKASTKSRILHPTTEGGRADLLFSIL